MSNLNQMNLTHQQQRLINLYINQYNQTNTHIDMLLDMLDEIRENIINVINVTQTRRNRINRHARNSNSNINRLINQIFNDRQNHFVYYDFQNPINPSLYNDFNINSTNHSNRRNNFYNMSFNRIHRNNRNNSNNVNNINNRNNSNNYNQNTDDFFSFPTNFLNTTVIVRPTTEQIQNASRIVRYGDIENPLSESCPISLVQFNDDDQICQLLYCGHIFHQNQFQEWFQSNVRCPLCRYDIRNYTPLSTRNIPNNLNSELLNNSTISSITNNNIHTTTATDSTQNQPNTPINTSTEPQIPLNTHQTSSTNLHVTRYSQPYQIGQSIVDINEQQYTNNFLDRVARNIFQSILNQNSVNNNDRYMIDPSNNILLYETIIRPNDNINSTQNNS